MRIAYENMLAAAGGEGEGYRLLEHGEELKEGDGFLHPDYNYWIDFKCRPDLFRKDQEFAHLWPWRRKIVKITATQPLTPAAKGA